MLFKKIIRHLPIILQVLNEKHKGAAMAVTMADLEENIMGTMSKGWLLLKMALPMIFRFWFRRSTTLWIRFLWGGSVRLGDAKGRGDEEAANAFFTASVLLMIVLASLLWVLFALFHDAVFIFFGASEEILPKVMEYAKWIIRFFPIFIAPTFIGSFVRNDGNPRLATFTVSPQIS